MPRLSAYLALLTLLSLCAADASAQTAAIRGFVTDEADGRELGGATVALYEISADSVADVPAYGAVTNSDGVYLVSRIEPGRYLFEISFVGFVPFRDTLSFAAYDIRSLSLELRPRTEEMDGVVIEEERGGGMTDVRAGWQTIRPEDVDRIPSLDISGDLASYLSSLPGVVSMGDQGGRFFVRGGEPSQNLVLVDGMHVYQPFHLLGYYSVFPTNILNRVEFYAGGFPSRYGTRLSSVIDVSTRNGNNRRHEGMASVSPFTTSARIEGPIFPGRVSYLFAGRESVIEHGAQRYLARDVPFQFGNAYGKIHARVNPEYEVSVTAMRSHERGTVGEATGSSAPQVIQQRNEAFGIQSLLLPRFYPLLANVYISHSRLTSTLGPSGDPTRSSSVRSTRFALDAYFPGRRIDFQAGWEAVFTYLETDLTGLYQNVAADNRLSAPGAFYGDWNVEVSPALELQAGARLQFFGVRLDPYVEPRIRATWSRGTHRLTAAAGMYQQELVGVNDRRDAASVFTAWTSLRRDFGDIPFVRLPDPETPGGSRIVFVDNLVRGRIARSYHGILGYHGTPTDWLNVSVEGFYKDVADLFFPEITALPQLSTNLHPASGRSGGFETRVEVEQGPFYGYLTYAFSSTRYASRSPANRVWYGTERLRFPPPHDRRHQVDALLSASLAGVDVGVRWAYGSGLPFTRPRGFDGFIPIDDVHDVFEQPRSRRVLYEEPYRGRMPSYHRLDVTASRSFEVRGGELTVQASVMNVYDRRNIFYYDAFTFERVDQLPVIPSVGLQLDIR